METAIMLGLFTLAASIFAAVMTAVSKKWRTPADSREDKALVLTDKDKVQAAQDRLIARFENLLKESDERHRREIEESDARHSNELRDVATKVSRLEEKVEIMQRERSKFVACIQHLVRKMRFYGHEDEIGELPDGIWV